MHKKSIIGGLALSALAGCALGPEDCFVYPEAVRELRQRNQYFSLENVVREQEKLYAGASAIEITPVGLPYLAGFEADRQSTGVADELFARCVVASYNNQTVAFVSLDLIGFMNENVQDVRALISQIQGNFVNNVIISSTHTHAGPDTIGLWGPGLPFLPLQSGLDHEYMTFLYDKIVESIYYAAKNLHEVRLLYASKEVPEERQISQNVETPDVIDRQLSVLQFVRPDNTPIATITNFACHPEALQRENEQVSPDFVGRYNIELERRLGGISVYLNQSIGGLISVERTGISDNEELQRVSHALVEETLECLPRAQPCERPVIRCSRMEFLVPLHNLYFELANDLGFVRKRDHDGAVLTEMNRIDIGDVQIITVPGEIFPNMGLNIKQHMNGRLNIIVGLANDELGYIMTPEDFQNNAFSYETSMSIGPQAGSLVEQTAVQLLRGE